MKVVAVEKSTYGKFYSGDSYILLNVSLNKVSLQLQSMTDIVSEINNA